MSDEQSKPPLYSAEHLRKLLSYNPDTGEFRWIVDGRRYGKPAGTISTLGYVQITIDRKSLYGHRIAWTMTYGESPKGHIDHIDGDRANNRLTNLRDVNRSVNLQNQRKAQKGIKSGLMGAYAHRPGKFVSYIMVDGKQIYLGYFNSAEAANQAYLEAKRKYHPGCTI